MRILFADQESRQSIFGDALPLPDVSAPVRDIIDRVRAEGDQALLAFTRQFDGAPLSSLRVSRQEMDQALASMPEDFLQVLRKAAGHIRQFHQEQARRSFVLSPRPGLTCGQRVLPIASVGLYVPGGTAAYPSSVLMNAIPAQIAGCSRIAMVSPPGPDGRLHPAILAAAHVAGLDEIYKLGGAQAIAALAYGSQSVAPVCKIVGPGNAYVAEAKRQVFGQVAIDMIAGPSEILIIADSGSRPDWLAADLLSQAEHDALASAVLVTPDEGLARAVAAEVARQLPLLPRHEIARASIEGRGKIIVVKDLAEAMQIANTIAPEHLELSLAQPFDWLDRVENAGSVFLGRYCPEAMGDYYIGCNHTLPTSGTARFSSALSVDDFVKKIQFSYYSKEAMLAEAGEVALFARQEGLEAHARSAECRLMEEEA